MNPNLSGMLSGASIGANTSNNTNAPLLSSATSFNSSQLPTSSSSGPNLSSQLSLDSPMISSGNVNVTSSSMSQPMSNSMPMPSQIQPQPQKDYNTSYLCRMGQETVQEIVLKTTELFQLLKAMAPPNGTNVSVSAQEDKKNKLREILKTVEMHFKRLRKMYEKCNECCIGMEYIQFETLIPMKDDDGKVVDDKKFSSSASKNLNKEHQDLVEVLQLRNRQIKEIIDNLRSIVWEINTMLAMRKP